MLNGGTQKPQDQWVQSVVPAIVSAADFKQVQESLNARSPRRTPPRVVSGPTLLTGLARCGTCDSGMTIRTGKSGRYRHYTCAGCAQKGKSFCTGRSISMAALDGMVIEHLADRLFTPERLNVILEAYVERSSPPRPTASAGWRRQSSGRPRSAARSAGCCSWSPMAPWTTTIRL